MTSTPSHKPDIRKIRKDIDRVDTALLGLIAERLELAGLVRASKSGVGVWRPSREESHVRSLAQKAGNTSPALISRIMAELMSASLAIQGPMTLHIALEGDALSTWSMVRDRFGASIPALSYPTTSAALSAVASTAEAVAVVPAPGRMNSWWTALMQGGAMEGFHILSALPRVDAGEWPQAVAVASTQMAPSGDDRSLIALTGDAQQASFKAGFPDAKLRASSADHALYSVEGFVDMEADIWQNARRAAPSLKMIGVFPTTLKGI